MMGIRLTQSDKSINWTNQINGINGIASTLLMFQGLSQSAEDPSSWQFRCEPW